MRGRGALSLITAASRQTLREAPSCKSGGGEDHRRFTEILPAQISPLAPHVRAPRARVRRRSGGLMGLNVRHGKSGGRGLR